MGKDHTDEKLADGMIAFKRILGKRTAANKAKQIGS
jgi:hypothetical protein